MPLRPHQVLRMSILKALGGCLQLGVQLKDTLLSKFSWAIRTQQCGPAPENFPVHVFSDTFEIFCDPAPVRVVLKRYLLSLHPDHGGSLPQAQVVKAYIDCLFDGFGLQQKGDHHTYVTPSGSHYHRLGLCWTLIELAIGLCGHRGEF